MSMSGPLRVVVLSVALGGLCESALSAHTPLADQPLIVSDVPPNVMLALSVEFPTAITRAHQGNTFDTSGRTEYLGYFDPRKCYVYEDPVFVPSGALTSADKGFACSGTWSGNFMNWATMQGVDTFRWVLTGGNRVVDEPQVFGGASGFPLGRTVLQRAYASPQGSYLSSNFPDRILDAQNLSSYTGLGSAYTGRTVTIRNGGMGIGVRFCTPEDICSVMTVNVEVCRDDSRGRPLEAFCQAYQDPTGTLTVYKPVGLIQRYKDKMYFGAFGYLQMGEANSLDAPGGTSNAYKDGGVLRSPVQSVANEISETGAFRLDPYGLKDASKAIGDSGTINYLNKFGSRSQAYKYYDPVSELYAEVIKYLRHKSPTASYLPPANADPLVYDGFPIFTRWDDPAKDAKYPDKGPLSCKRNYVIGIGDTNSNFDFELSGMGAGGSPSSHNHATPSDVDYDMAGKTARDWTDAVGALEGLGALSTQTIANGSYLMAGIAYFAHSSDIRPDIPGVQTVSTYWMDVLEGGYLHRNQYWLAAKYGGFVKAPDVAKSFEAGKDAWKAVGRKDGSRYPGKAYDLPMNYYTAGDPDSMREGLAGAFQSIAAGAGAGAGAALSSVQVSATSGGANTYQGSYDAAMWSGDVVASRVDKVNLDQPVLTRLWSAAERLDAMGSDARRIVTLAPRDKTKLYPLPGDLAGVAFRWSDLGAAQQLNLSRGGAAPAGDPADGEAVLNYLRGDRSSETTETVQRRYRQRKSVLGDIVDSRAVYVGKPSASYSDTYNPGYSSFVAEHAGRTPMVVVGANDGMLHAFDATDGSDGGRELFALVPYSVFEGPDGNPEVSGIQAIARKTYSHRYFMNATPEIRDVDFARTGGKLESFPTGLSPDWRTLLVVGQGKGGRSFVAMDVTHIPSSASESDIAQKVLWEFTHPDMGFSFGRPLIAKTRRWGWVVILTGGYNNTRGRQPGRGALFVLNARTGALLTEHPLYTSSGTANSPSGLAQIEGYTPSYQDYTLDYVYGGDLDGNLWRFDFTSADRDLPPVVKLAEFVVGGLRQPVTVAPKIEYSAEDLKRYVFVGTGRLLASEDLANSQQHTMYAVRDGTKSRAYGNEAHQVPLPDGASFPVTRTMLSPVTDLIGGAKLQSEAPMGWYTDLTGDFRPGDGKAPVTERVVLSLQANDGVLSWVGSILNDDPCNASGTARVYAVYYGNGQSILHTRVDGLAARTRWIEVTDAGLADTTLVRVGTSIRILGTDVKGVSRMYGSAVAEAGNPRVVNWRIIRDQ
ncbi:MAG: hypothetical protein J0L85_14975 [Zoogloea sp.]|nr:hypothetical protein [Zoogloea sp.]